MTHTSHASRQQRRQPQPPAYVGIRGYTDQQPAMAACQQQAQDSTVDADAYLAIAADTLSGAVHWLALALKERPALVEALGLELDTLRGLLAAVEAELPAERQTAARHEQ